MSATLLASKFGPYGGQYVPETLMPALIELERAFVEARQDPAFRHEYDELMASYVGRPTCMSICSRASRPITDWNSRTMVG